MSGASKVEPQAEERPVVQLPRGWMVFWLALLAWVLFVLVILGIWKAVELTGPIVAYVWHALGHLIGSA